MDKIKIFRRLYICLGSLFIASLTVHPYPGSYILKALPILIMAYLSYSYLKGCVKILMVSAFLFCTAGDVLLDVSRVNYFVPALVSFMIAHILYSVVFFKDFKFKKQRLIIVAAIIIYVSLIFCLSELGSLFIPVLIYILVITIMGIIVSFSDRPINGVLLGVLLFIVSDSLIAINKFIHPLPYSTFLNITIYYWAQYEIGMGMLLDKK
jgi:alkenylglycerophosphocholine hydrolase